MCGGERGGGAVILNPNPDCVLQLPPAAPPSVANRHEPAPLCVYERRIFTRLKQGFEGGGCSKRQKYCNNREEEEKEEGGEI